MDARRLTSRPRVGSRRVRVVDQVAVVGLLPRGSQVRPPASTSRRSPRTISTMSSPTDSRSRSALRRPHVERAAPWRAHRPVLDEQRRRGRRRARRPPGADRSRQVRATVSPQPPFSASPRGSRVTTVTAPPRSKASTCSAAGPSASTRRVRREQLGPVAAQPQRASGERLLGVGLAARAPARRRRSRPAAGCRGRPGSGRRARCPGRRPARRGRSATAAWPRARCCGRRPPGRRRGPRGSAAPPSSSKAASTAACTACSYASSGSVHVVRSPASRIAFSA